MKTTTTLEMNGGPVEPTKHTKVRHIPEFDKGKEPIPVKVLRCRHGESVDFPGKAGGSSLTAGGTPAKRWAIDWLPWRRQFRIAFTADGATVTMYIPDTWATMEVEE